MHHSTQMFETHPVKGQIDMSDLSRCIDECFSCASTCVICADACLGEKKVDSLVRCIRLNQDCADICIATGRALSRQVEPDWDTVRSVVEACAAACRACAAECENHASHHKHCATCAESCRSCEQACRRVLRKVPAGVGVRS
jgi:hypothetical protein